MRTMSDAQFMRLALRLARRGRQFFLLVCVALATHISAQEIQFTRKQVIEQMKPYTGSHVAGVDASTLTGKVMCGYQGWFAAPGDGSGTNWVHYGENRSLFAPGHCVFDLWPDVSELGADEKFPTAFKHQDGSTAYVFSPCNPRTVLRHFQWMRDYGIDGVFLQRFGADLKSANGFNHNNVVAANVQAGANQCGRTWAMMYDLSGLRPGEIQKFVADDWKQLVDRMKITSDPAYLHHRGKPVVAVWGIGFNDGRKYSLEECEALIQFLKSDPKYGGNTVMVGVPAWWRTLDHDAMPDKKLLEIVRLADIVSPWNVGRYGNPAEAKSQAINRIQPDIAWCRTNGKEYLPVIFPGFSWHNLMKTRGQDGAVNQIPRLKGNFLWAQAVADRRAGASMLYVAMFDEINEGTAIFKCTDDPPVGESPFVTMQGLPSDHYLWLTGQIGKLLRKEIPAIDTLPQR
jgi:hypothetical protein